MYLKNKQSILNNILKLTIYYNLLLSLTFPKDAAKNVLMLNIDVTIMQANNELMDLKSTKYNYLNEGLRTLKEIIELVEQY